MPYATGTELTTPDAPPADVHTDSCPSCFNCTAPDVAGPAPHAILNVLDTFQHFMDKNLFLWYGTDAFEGTEKAWEKVPLVFAQDHPDGRTLYKDIDVALRGVRTHDGKPGRIAGSLRNVRIVKDGQPRIETDFVFTDPEVERLWHENKLGLSSSTLGWSDPFQGMPENHRRARPGAIPNHVLIFVRTPTTRPGDGGAMFLNNTASQPSNSANSATIQHSGETMVDTTESKAPESPIEKKLAEMDLELRNMKAAWNQAQADIKVKDEKIALAELEKHQQEWNRLAAVLPRGWVHGEKEKESRDLFEKDPAEFCRKLVTALNESHAQAMEKAGEEYQRKQATPPARLKDYVTGLVVNGVPVGE